jgi:two-component system NtrC family sensor kinase
MRLASELEQRVHDLTVLHAIGRSMTQVMPLDELLTRIVDAALQLTQAEEAFLLLYEPSAQRLAVRAAKTAGDERAQVLRLPVQESIAGDVLRTGRPLRLTRQQAEHPAKLKTGYLVRALLLAPLLLQGRPLGVLGVDNVAEATPFTEAHERLLVALGDYAAIALENTRLFEARERSEARYRDLFTNANDVLFVLDKHQTVVEINNAGPQLLGYTAEMMVGQPLQRLLHETQWPYVQAQLQRVFTDQAQIPPFELELRKCDDSHVRMEVAVRVIYDGDDQRLLCSARNLTERLALQAQAVHAEKLVALEHTVAGVAHELNNPLASIVGYSQLMLRDSSLPPDAHHDVERILDQAKQAGSIVQGLLTFGRGVTGSRTAINITSLIESTLELPAAYMPPSINIVRVLAPNLPTVQADPYQMQQVLLNLISNARRATQLAGGTLTIRSKLVDDLAQLRPQPPTSPLPPQMQGPAVVVEIADTGVGIPSHQLSRIFDPFWTTKIAGAGVGLGLSVCHGIIIQHGGYIWATSTVDRGTTFTIALPPRKRT